MSEARETPRGSPLDLLPHAAGQFDLEDLAALLADVDAVLWEARPDTWETTFVSPSVERILGHPLEDWRRDRKLFVALLHPEDREAVLERAARVARSGGRADSEYRLRTKTGSYVWFRDIMRAVTDAAGRVRLRGVGLDVTHLHWEREWNASNRRLLEAIARRAPLDEVLHRIVEETERHTPGCRSSIVTVGEDGRLRSGPAPSFPDEYHRAIEGLEPGEGVGSCGTAIFRRERVVVEDVATDPLWEKGRALVLPLGLRSCWSQPILASNGSVLGAFAIYDRKPSRPSAEQITAIETAAALAGIAIEREHAERLLHESEEQLRHAQKMEALGRLAGGMAHDFNNILTTIFGHAEHLLAECGGAGSLAAHASGVFDGAQRAAAITRRLLAVSRKQVLELRTLELNEVVQDVGAMLRRLIGEDIELITRLDARAGFVRADRFAIEQVVMNLAINARDAMPAGGRLILETSRAHLASDYVECHAGAAPGAYALLSVTDTGTGMDAHTRARAFEPFFTTKEVGKGTGLGLSMVYAIVKQLRGNVWCYSEPGRGTTFKVYWPAVDTPAEAEPPAPPAPRPTAGDGRTVLVAEDEPTVRRLVTDALERHGFRVLAASDGEAALAVAREHAGVIDLLLTDVVMPRASGPDLARRVRSDRPGIQVLFMSGYTETAVQLLDELDPASSFLEKPFSPSTLAARVAALLGV